jgi:hypothetical protein
MLSVYLDESGTHLGSKTCVVAGLVASPLQWERLERSWQKTLDSVSLADFHSADCANGGGAFKGWEKKDRESIYSRLTKVITRFVAYRVWTAVVIDDYHSVFRDSNEIFPYSLCALGCASRLLSLGKKRGSDFTITYVFDQGPKGKWAFASFERLRERENSFRMGPLTKGDRHGMVPLQAADLHAYEVYKYFADQLAQNGRSPRGSLCELLKIADGGGYLLNGDKIEMLTRGIKRQALSGIIEPIGIPIDVLNTENRIKLLPPLPAGLRE